MMGLRRSFGLAIGVWTLCVADPVAAQENLDAGKTPAQLFASNCAICHDSVQGLSKVGGISGLKDFLSEPYTASKETAAAIAAYVATNNGPAPAKRATTAKRAPKSDAKSSDAKSGENNLDWFKTDLDWFAAPDRATRGR